MTAIILRGLQNPIALLLATGFLIGLNFPLGKVAVEAGVSPLLWAVLISVGASVSKVLLLLVQRVSLRLNHSTARYALISGIITFVLANWLVFAVIPHVGSGFIGIMFALSPVFTLAIATLFRLKTPGRLGLAGIAVGLIGATIVAWSRQTAQLDISPIWIFAAILVPFTLAVGNVYRTIAWPHGESPDRLAFWSHAFSAILLVFILLGTQGNLGLSQLAAVPGVSVAQFIVAGMTFPIFFRLQQFGGPVLLSQLGYVAAAVGMAAATLFLGESYRLLTWGGAAIIALGVAFTILAQRNAS